MEVKLPNGSVCSLRSTWSELGYGKNTELSPGVFTLEVNSAVNEKRAAVAAYRNETDARFFSNVKFGKASTEIVRRVFPSENLENAGLEVQLSDNVIRKYVTMFLERFSMRTFSDMNGVMESMINVYKDYKDGNITLNPEETYQGVMSQEWSKKTVMLRRLMSSATTSKLYNIPFFSGVPGGYFGVNYQVFTTRTGKTLNIYLRQTQDIDGNEILQHLRIVAGGLVGRISKVVLGFLKWSDISPLMKIVQGIDDYELENDPLIVEFLKSSVPLEYYTFAAMVFSAIKNDLLQFVNENHSKSEECDIKIYGYSLGGGIGCALMCLISFWKKMHELGRLKAKVTCLLVGQINLFTEVQSSVINSFMLKHLGRFNMFSVSHVNDYATSLSSNLAESGGLRIELIDYSYISDGRSVHTITQYIESMDRFYVRMSGISIGGTYKFYKDVTTLIHVRAFATLPSSVVARGSTQVKMAQFKSIRQPRTGSAIEMAIQQDLLKKGFKAVYVRPTYFYFTDFTVNPNTSSAIGEQVSGAARVFIKSTLAEFQSRLFRGSVARSSAGINGMTDGSIVVPIVERIYIGPSTIYSHLFLGTSTASTWNGYRTYGDQYGGIYIKFDELKLQLFNLVRFIELPERHRKKRGPEEQSLNEEKNMNTSDLDGRAVAIPSRKQPPSKRQKTRE